MLDRKQMVAEIADEVVARLLAHLDAPGAGRPPRRAPARRRPRAGPEEAGARPATASSRPWTRRCRPRPRRRCASRR